MGPRQTQASPLASKVSPSCQSSGFPDQPKEQQVTEQTNDQTAGDFGSQGHLHASSNLPVSLAPRTSSRPPGIFSPLHPPLGSFLLLPGPAPDGPSLHQCCRTPMAYHVADTKCQNSQSKHRETNATRGASCGGRRGGEN